jgi:hypothetical protein
MRHYSDGTKRYLDTEGAILIADRITLEAIQDIAICAGREGTMATACRFTCASMEEFYKSRNLYSVLKIGLNAGRHEFSFSQIVGCGHFRSAKCWN